LAQATRLAGANSGVDEGFWVLMALADAAFDDFLQVEQVYIIYNY
jgi:hypothetical protein